MRLEHLHQSTARGYEPNTLNSEARDSSAARAFATGGSLTMSFDIDEEHVVPFSSARRARFDPRHVDSMLRERLEH